MTKRNITDIPIGLSEEFYSNANKNTQWKAFLNKSGLDDMRSLEETVTRLNVFFNPLLKVFQKSSLSLKKTWKHPGPWI